MATTLDTEPESLTAQSRVVSSITQTFPGKKPYLPFILDPPALFDTAE